MKKFIYTALFTTSFLVQANTISTSQLRDTFTPNSWRFSIASAVWDYREFDENGGQFMRDSGILNGLKIDYERQFSNRFNFQFGLLFLEGDTEYEGALQSLSNSDLTPYNTTSENAVMDLGIDIGYRLNSSKDLQNSFVAHIGMHSWVLRNFESPDDPFDYDRKITYAYVPVGLMYKRAFTKGIFHFDVNYNYFRRGEVISGGFGTLKTFDQNKGRGTYTEIGYSQLFKSFGLDISAYYRTWDIADSESITVAFSSDLYSFYEPENTTEMIGLNLGISF